MLKYILLANAASCVMFGLIFVFFGQETSTFVGGPPIVLVQLLGAGLVINSVLLIRAALKFQPARSEILTFVIGDAAWVLVTAILLFSETWITTSQGVFLSVAVAAFVGICGLMQWRFLPGGVRAG